MKFDARAGIALVAAMACLQACDPRPKPAPPKTQAIAATQEDARTPGAGGGAFGVGIRPGRSASGIMP